jgi:hypothetical protein
VTTIEVKAAGVTVKAVTPETLPKLALMFEVPVASVEASPWVPAALLMEATPVALDVQLAVVVKSRVLPSLYVPTALNCWVVPRAADEFAGVTAIESNAAGFTVSVVDPVTAPEVALIVVVPDATALAKPALLMVATFVAVDFQVAELVRFLVLPSL